VLITIIEEKTSNGSGAKKSKKSKGGSILFPSAFSLPEAGVRHVTPVLVRAVTGT
jgi:hypothetical protein